MDPPPPDHYHMKGAATVPSLALEETRKMTTQLEDHGTHWVVKTVESDGKRRRRGRLPIAIPKGDPEALRREIIRQADALRLKHGIAQPQQEPVA